MSPTTLEDTLAELVAPPSRGAWRPVDAQRFEAGAWPDIFSAANARGIEPQIAHRIVDDPTLTKIVPAQTRRLATARVMQTEARNTIYGRALAPLFDDLEARGIDVCLLKGAALTSTVFPLGARRLNDVDLLIDRRDFLAVTEALGRAGFVRPVSSAAEDDLMFRVEHAVPFWKESRGGAISIDLHWSLMPPDAPMSIASDAVLARATTTDGLFGAPACTYEDLVVHLAGQLRMDRLQFGLARVVDVAHVVNAGIDWDTLVHRATASRTAGLTHLLLSMAATIGADVDEDALARLARTNAAAPRVSRFVARPGVVLKRKRLRHGARVVLEPLLIDSRRARLFDALSMLWPNRRSAIALQILPDDDPSTWDDAGLLLGARARAIGGAAASAALLVSRSALAQNGLAALVGRVDGLLLVDGESPGVAPTTRRPSPADPRRSAPPAPPGPARSGADRVTS